ncbi:MAG: phosphotransferase, partial [Candidatus Heimdallarchaeota archaeon]|nr:phosphotransferase [Candidatus Heimdallarchaeota archaeon]
MLPRDTPKISIALATEFLWDHYSVKGQVKPLPAESDQNFLVITDKNLKFILKIHFEIKFEDFFRFQNTVLNSLCDTATNKSFPQVVKSIHGEELIEVSVSDSVYLIRLLTYVSGTALALFQPKDRDVLRTLGETLGYLDKRLQLIDHSSLEASFTWDLEYASEIIASCRNYWLQDSDATTIHHFQDLYNRFVAPLVPDLQKGLIHNDANDYNVLVNVDLQEGKPEYSIGLIDFGDLVFSRTIYEVAICSAYAILHSEDPLSIIAEILIGYHTVNPVTEMEIEVLFILICMRLCVSISMSIKNRAEQPDNEHLFVTEKPARLSLELLKTIDPSFATAYFRWICGFQPIPHSQNLYQFILRESSNWHPVFGITITDDNSMIIDLSLSSSKFTMNELQSPEDQAKFLPNELMKNGKEFGIGKFGEIRPVYYTEAFEVHNSTEFRETHLGIDIFTIHERDIYAPLDGEIVSITTNSGPYEYGGLLITKHKVANGQFYLLFGHLDPESLENYQLEDDFEKGSPLATLAKFDDNGHWPVHLHIQVIFEASDVASFPGVVTNKLFHFWKLISPDPGPLFLARLNERNFSNKIDENLLSSRNRLLGSNLSLAYSEPIEMVRGYLQYLYDSTGGRFLDLVNNVPHVGHNHPY